MFTNCEQTEIPTWLPHLSEGRYRKYWEMTKDAPDEEARFREAMRLLDQSEDRRTKHTNEIGVAIRAKFMDGKWHSPATIAKAIGHPEAEIIDTLDRAVSRKSGNITYLAERAHRRRGVYEYRMFSKEKTISTMVLTEKLAPIIKTLRTQGKTNMATVSIAAIAFAGSELQALLDEWSQ